MSKIDWRRCAYQMRVRHGGAVRLADEREWLDRDRAARWLGARLSPKRRAPQRPATAPSSAVAPWE
jgi:hypothetical protein